MLQNCHRGLSSGCHRLGWYWAARFCFCWLCSQQIWMQVPQLPLGQIPHIQKYHLAKKGKITQFLQDRENLGRYLYFYVCIWVLNLCECVWVSICDLSKNVEYEYFKYSNKNLNLCPLTSIHTGKISLILISKFYMIWIWFCLFI